MTNSSICSRSIAAAFALSISALLAPGVLGQTTATTVPVGFITKSIPAAIDAVTPSNTVLSVPLYQTADFQSSISTTPSAGTHTVTLTSATFTTSYPAGQFTNTPHLLRVKTGALTGKFWIISSYSANSLDLKEPTGGTPGVADANVTGLLVNDSCEILPANTFGSTFGLISGLGTTTANNGNGALTDNILVWNGTSYDKFYYKAGTANRWQNGISDATNTVIFPDDALFFVRKVTSTLPITLMGTVPSTQERNELVGSSNNFIANRFPVGATLGTSQIETTPGWVKATANNANGVDTVLLWNGTSFDKYYFKGGTANRWQLGISDATNTPIPVAEGMFITRVTGTGDAVLTQTLPYSL